MAIRFSSNHHSASMATSYDALAALGAPISLEEYQPLATGALGDALSFLSGHIVGRDAAATARRTLFSFQEAQAKSQLKQPATTRSRADKAAARIASGKTSSGVHSAQLEELQTKLNTSSMRATELRSNLNDKRTLILLLNVLEAKHELRTKRIEALTRAINELRPVNGGTSPISSGGIRVVPSVEFNTGTKDK
ncbi:hypothetical protein C8R46DRAFT_1076970 [Mycena filopes]|nr:hypothetical protein C8R46DRAFT_1076970 [Mycena filopes]